MPVARHVVLQELQIAIALEFPEIRLLYHDTDRYNLWLLGHWCSNIRQIQLLRKLLVDIIANSTRSLKVRLVIHHQVRATQIDIHHRLVNGISHRIV